MNIVQRMAKISSIYFVGKGLSGIVTFVMLPIYTNKISTSAYGTFDTINTIIAVLVPVVCMEIWSGVLRISYEKDDPCYVKKVCQIGVLIYSLGMLLLGIGIAIAKFFFSFHFACLTFLLGITLGSSLLLCDITRANKKNFDYAISGVLATVTNATVGVLCVFVFKNENTALFFATISGYFFQSIFLVIKNQFWQIFHDFKIEKNVTQKLVKFCWPLIFNTITNYMSTNFNRVWISFVLGSSMTGIFGVANKFVSIVTLIGAVFQYAWLEITYGINNKILEERCKVYSEAIHIFSKAMAGVVICTLPLISVVFPIFVGSDFSEAKDVIPIYYASLWMTLITGFLLNIFMAENYTFAKLILRLIACVINVGLLIVLIYPFDLYGVSMAIVIGSLVEMLLLILFLRKRIQMKFYWGTIGFYIIFYVGSMICFNQTILMNIIWFVISIACTAMYCRRELKRIYLLILKKE